MFLAKAYDYDRESSWPTEDTDIPEMMGLGQLNVYAQPLDDWAMQQKIMSLTRSAALKAFQKPGTLSGLSAANDEQDFERRLEAEVTRELQMGLVDGSLYDITERDFESELYQELMGSGELAGFFSSIKRAVKKVIKAPAKIVKKVAKVAKKVGKKAFKVVKKVAPIAAAGAALYFGGPYVLSGLKAAGGAVMKYGGMIASKFMGGTQAPPEQIVETATAPEITNAGVDIATDLARQKGVNMASSAAQTALKQYMLYQQQKIAQRQPQTQLPPTAPRMDVMTAQRPTGTLQPPPVSPAAAKQGGDIAKMAIPAALAVGAMFMMKG
jgi:hypothetical protein